MLDAFVISLVTKEGKDEENNLRMQMTLKKKDKIVKSVHVFLRFQSSVGYVMILSQLII